MVHLHTVGRAMKNFHPRWLLAASCLLPVTPMAWAQQAGVSLRHIAQATGAPQYLFDQGSSSELSDAGSSVSSTASASVAGRVNYGVIQLAGDAHNGSATSVGIFQDIVSITSPQVADGTAGVLTYTIQVNGALQAGGGNASWGLQAKFGGGSLPNIDRNGTQFSDHFSGDAIGNYTGQAVFIFGNPTPLTVTLSGGAVGSQASYDLGHSAYWGGVESITVGTLAVTSFSMMGVSGTRYETSLAPVPEASAMWLALIGLPVVHVVSRRRRTGNRRSGPACLRWLRAQGDSSVSV